MRGLCTVFAVILLIVNSSAARLQEGVPVISGFSEALVGPVKTIRVEKAQLLKNRDKYTESSRAPVQEIFYDARHRKTVEINYGDDGAVSVKKVFNYDVEGQVKEIIEYKSDGSLIGRRVHTQEKNSVKEVTYNSNNTLDFDKVINTFDEEGRQIGVETFNREGDSSTKAVISYREGGSVVEVAMCTRGVGGNDCAEKWRRDDRTIR